MEAEKQKLPGKKLPIWINRNDTLFSHVSEAKSTALMTSSIKFENNQSACEQTEERQSEQVANKAAKSNIENEEIKGVNTYQKRKDGEKPKIPRKLREMNEHLMFEKILKTGSKNSLFVQCDEQSDNVVLEKDIKDLSKEHLERAKMIEQEDDVNSEYLDNSEFLVGDELESISATNVANDDEINLPGTRINTDVISINADQNQKDDNIIEKSTRNLEIAKVDKCATEITESPNTIIPDNSSIILDDALKDFVKEAEEDSAQSNPNKPRRGRPPKSLEQFPITDLNTSSSSEMEDDVYKNQEKMIQELLKKNPQLLKSKKPIQIKIMVVNKGKKVAQTLTIKPVLDEPASPSSHQDQKPMIPGFRPIQKVNIFFFI